LSLRKADERESTGKRRGRGISSVANRGGDGRTKRVFICRYRHPSKHGRGKNETKEKEKPFKSSSSPGYSNNRRMEPLKQILKQTYETTKEDFARQRS